MEVDGECHVAELVCRNLGQEIIGEIQRKTRLQRIEEGLEFLSVHRGQAGDQFIQFVIGHGVYTQQMPSQSGAAGAAMPVGFLVRIDGLTRRIEWFREDSPNGGAVATAG